MKKYINLLIILFSVTILSTSCKKGDEPVPTTPPNTIVDSLQKNNIYKGEFKEVNPSDTSTSIMWYTITKDSIFESYAYAGSPGNYTYYTIEDKAGLYGGEVKFINDSSFVGRYINPGNIYDNEHYVLVSNDKNKVFTFIKYSYTGDILSNPNSGNTNFNSTITFVKL